MARLFDDASNQYLQAVAVPVTTTPCTLAGWFYSDAERDHNIISVAQNGGSVHYFTLFANWATPSKVEVYQRGSLGASYAITTTAWSMNTWHHACGVFSTDASRAAYLDGGGKGTNSTDVGATSGLDTTWIGRHFSTYFSGAIAEVGAWNVALADAWVAVLALGISPLLVQPASLTAYYPLIRGDQDRVGGYHLTAVNGPTIATHPPKIRPWWARPVLLRVAAPAIGAIYGERGTLRGIFRGACRGV